MFSSLPGFTQQFPFEDPAQMIMRVEQLLQDPGEQAQLAASNAEVYDKSLSPVACADRIVHQLFNPP